MGLQRSINIFFSKIIIIYLYEFLKKILKFYSEIKKQRQKCTNNKGNTHMIWNKTKKSKSE